MPNITGWANACMHSYDDSNQPTGVFSGSARTSDGSQGHTSYTAKWEWLNFDASRSNSIYGNSNTVQPPAYIVNIWERTA